ncbi:MAG: molybdenum cofactor guanylyltransferase, partial [Lachnospiraceae bacterium]
RMGGSHKGFLTYEDNSFMERLIDEMGKMTEQILISYGTKIHAEYAGCRIVTDEYPECGPIGGIHAGLKACETDVLMVAACDMPFLEAEFFTYLREELKDSDGVVPVTAGKKHPLAAIYKKNILPVLGEQIKNGNYRLTDALKKLDINYVDVTGQEKFERMLKNINTIEDYQNIENVSSLK